ncbi:MAG TPA: DUF2339 domain-containing protein [Gemmataceae bacterium]|nr:DUF2339 domain-containing protein [Gemmataceae bacterium]
MPDEVPPSLEEVCRRLDTLEQRLASLEAVLRPAPAPAPSPSIPTSSEPRRPEHPLLDIAGSRRGAVEEILSALPAERPGPSQPVPALTAIRTVIPRPRTAHASHEKKGPQTPAPRQALALEQTIGLKWAGWVGAIVLVSGVALGIKFAYDQGWFGHVPVPVRLLLMSLGGFLLIAAGEIVYRRINPISSVGPFGAGVAVLFVVSYAGNIYYQEYSYNVAFAFAVLSTLVGSAVAMRGRLASIAVLSQLGGQLAPILLSSGQQPGVPLLTYVFTLQIVALLLALWGKFPKWWVLRSLSLAATAWWVAVCLDSGKWGSGLTSELLWFAVLYAAAYQGELLRSALLVGSGESKWGMQLAQGWGTLFSALVTAGLTAVILDTFYRHDSAMLRGCSTLLLSALCLSSGFLLVARENRLVTALAAGYRLQGLGLLILAVPVSLTGSWICLTWAVLSLTLAALGARFDRWAARLAASAAWLLALGRLMVDAIDKTHESAHATWLTLLNQPIPGYTVLAWLLAGVGLILAWLLQLGLAPLERSRITFSWQRAWFISILASLVWIVAALEALPPVGAAFAILLWGWLLVCADYVPQQLSLTLHGLAVFLIATIQWVVFAAAGDRFSPQWNALHYLPVLNPVMGVGALLAASLWGVTVLRRSTFEALLRKNQAEPIPVRAWAFATVALSVGLLVLGLTFEVDRMVERQLAQGFAFVAPPLQVKLLWLSLLGTAYALILALAARRLVFPNLLPWILLIVVAAKFLFVDMLYIRLNVTAQPVPVRVFLNLEMLTAGVILAAFFALRRLVPPASLGRSEGAFFRGLADLTALFVLLTACTLEIDRAFATSLAADFKNPVIAKHVAVSLFWSLFAISSVSAGFRFRTAFLRYFGLGLFGATLLKVAILDISQVEYGYRVLSLIGLGLVLLVTSVLYGYVSPKLLNAERPQDEAVRPAANEENVILNK